MSEQWWRLGGVFGLAFLVLFIVAIILQGESPTYDDPVDEIRQYWVDDGQRYLVGDFLFGVAFMLFFLPFIVVLRELLGRAEGTIQLWSRVAFGAGLISIILGAVAGIFWGGMAFGNFAEGASDETLQLLMILDLYAFSTLALTLGTFILASSIVMVLTGVLWRWLGALGVIVGIAAIISTLGILSEDPEGPIDIIGFIAFIGLAVWLLLTSAGMLMRKAEPMVYTETVVIVE